MLRHYQKLSRKGGPMKQLFRWNPAYFDIFLAPIITYMLALKTSTLIFNIKLFHFIHAHTETNEKLRPLRLSHSID